MGILTMQKKLAVIKGAIQILPESIHHFLEFSSAAFLFPHNNNAGAYFSRSSFFQLPYVVGHVIYFYMYLHFPSQCGVAQFLVKIIRLRAY